MNKDMKFVYGMLLSIVGLMMFFEILGHYI